MAEDFRDKDIKSFLSKLFSKAAVPGGGGASALAGALGAALGGMVCSLTVGKKKYKEVEEEIISLSEQLQEICDRLADCINRDAEAFAPLAEAYSIPAGTPGRNIVMENCLRQAASVPCEILELSCGVVPILERLAEIGSRNVVSDAATGAVMCRAAIQGAAANIYVNTALMKDRGYAEELNSKTEQAVTESCAAADRLFDSIIGGIRK